MALVAHFDLHLHRIDVKTAFLNGNQQEGIYMKQPEGFVQEKGENLVCKLCKSIDGLKQVLDSENSLDECNYMKKSGRNFIILVLNREKWVLGLSQKNYIEKVIRMISNQHHGEQKDKCFQKKIRDGYTGSEHINTTDMTADPLTKGLGTMNEHDISISTDSGLVGILLSYVSQGLKV
ncbi:unnamed protein product [Prunus armeniaca]